MRCSVADARRLRRRRRRRPRPRPPPQSESRQPAAAEGDGTLTIGSLLPQTGNLAFLGPPEFAGVELAIKEINEAGGVLDKDVAYIEGDSGDTSQDIANPTVDRLLAADVDVIIGAASSGVSLTVIDKITSAGVVQYSPANTAADFTDYDDKGLYFRTAPPDVLQGRILGETILADGCTNVGVLALQDPYGEGLAELRRRDRHRRRRHADARGAPSSTTRPPRTSTPRSTSSRPPTPAASS